MKTLRDMEAGTLAIPTGSRWGDRALSGEAAPCGPAALPPEARGSCPWSSTLPPSSPSSWPSAEDSRPASPPRVPWGTPSAGVAAGLNPKVKLRACGSASFRPTYPAHCPTPPRARLIPHPILPTPIPRHWLRPPPSSLLSLHQSANLHYCYSLPEMGSTACCDVSCLLPITRPCDASPGSEGGIPAFKPVLCRRRNGQAGTATQRYICS